MNKKILFGTIGILAIAIIVMSIRTSTPGKYDDFAKCLSEKNAKMYGAYWCSHCNNQKEMFGKSWKYVDYVECAYGNGQSIVCTNAGVKAYPTWSFENMELVEGELSFEDLSKKTGCQLENFGR